MGKVLEEDLRQFIGTTMYHRLTILPLNCTDGVAYFAQKAEAYWLVDEIALTYYYKGLKDNQFIVIKVEAKDNKADVEYSDGNDKVLHKEHYDFTDLDGSYKFYLTNNVLMLPMEY